MSLLPQWPPVLEDGQRDELSSLAATWALSHGLVYFPISPTDRGSAIHAPFTLLPSLFPRELFQRAQNLQKAYNFLYSRIALDRLFLDTVMGNNGGVSDVDPFTRDLWNAWKTVRDLPNQQVSFIYLSKRLPNSVSLFISGCSVQITCYINTIQAL
jgi:glutathione synthase